MVYINKYQTLTLYIKQMIYYDVIDTKIFTDDTNLVL